MPQDNVKKTEAPMTTAQKPVNNFFGGGLGDFASRTLAPFIQLAMIKQFQDANDNEFGYGFDPYSGQIKIGEFNTVGSVGPRSLWQATDMLWVGGAAVLVLGIYLLKHK